MYSCDSGKNPMSQKWSGLIGTEISLMKLKKSKTKWYNNDSTKKYITGNGTFTKF